MAIAFSENNKVVFLNAKKNGFDNVAINENLVVKEWPGKRPTGWKDFLFIVKLMSNQKPDIIVTNFAANNIMLLASWLFGVKYRCCYYQTVVDAFIEDHGKLGWVQQLKIFRKGFVLRTATHMLAPSTYAKKDLLHYFGVNESNIYVFQNTIAASSIFNQSKNNVIGYAGRLDKTKGVDILIKAFIKIAALFPDVELILVGGGTEREVLEAMIKEAGLADRVKWNGVVSYEEVFELLLNINFLVVPSRIDNLPTVVIEAFSVSTPVIGSNSGGIPDMIIPEYNGYLFERENVDDLVEKMKLMLSKRDQRNVMAENAKKTFEEKYCTDTLRKRFEALIENTQ
jgi:glycosyltransferase involved in cell wall biosynthesis